MKTRVVLFTENNARVLVNPHNLEELMANKNAVINPCFKAVMKEPPHFWKRSGNKVVPMTRPEKKVRLLEIQARGVTNHRPARPILFKIKAFSHTHYFGIATFILGAVLSYLVS